jgi:ribosomal protein S18 acetylase RimI-like enzyme
VLANPTHFAAVAEERGRIYGLVHAYERPALEKACEVVLQSLVVDQRARKRGIGKGLMTAAEAWAKSRGIEQVVLHTRIDRDDARSFYEHIGYNLTATSRCARFAVRRRRLRVGVCTALVPLPEAASFLRHRETLTDIARTFGVSHTTIGRLR